MRASIHDETCLRVTGLLVGELAALAPNPDDLAGQVRVYPTSVLEGNGTYDLQPVAGTFAVELRDNAVSFAPRFPFIRGTPYTVLVHRSLVKSGSGGLTADDDDFVASTIRLPAPQVEPTTRVIDIWPSAAVIPRNALRVYVKFSAPMSEGFASTHVSVRDAATGVAIEDALLAMNPELWDRHRRRLTMLFDPARIKRGLVPHEEIGYPLTVGVPVEIVVHKGFLDAKGQPLVESRSRRYEVVDDVRDLIRFSSWKVVVPEVGSSDALVVEFDRSLDRGLLEHCLAVMTVDGAPVEGGISISEGERAWEFWPDDIWPATALYLVIDPILEDIAGNTLKRVFDRDVTDANSLQDVASAYKAASSGGGVDLTVVAQSPLTSEA